MSEHHDLFPSNDDEQSVSDRLSAEALIVDVDGFEGPLDLLLTLSRTQKVDLMRISILELAQQYLDFVERAKALRIELAADYLVMAAWLAFLKSRLLLPPDPADEGQAAKKWPLILRFNLNGFRRCGIVPRASWHGIKRGVISLFAVFQKMSKPCAR